MARVLLVAALLGGLLVAAAAAMVYLPAGVLVVGVELLCVGLFGDAGGDG